MIAAIMRAAFDKEKIKASKRVKARVHSKERSVVEPKREANPLGTLIVTCISIWVALVTGLAPTERAMHFGDDFVFGQRRAWDYVQVLFWQPQMSPRGLVGGRVYTSTPETLARQFHGRKTANSSCDGALSLGP